MNGIYSKKMRLLLIGVLLGFLQGTFEEGFYNNAFFQRFPFQLRKPFVQDYYKPPLSPDFFYQPQRRSDDNEGIITPFHRGHVESPSHLHPIVLVKSRPPNHWRIPLRDAVQKVPIQGEMNRLLKSSFQDNGENNPFSRSHVEAFPQHKSSLGITAENNFYYNRIPNEEIDTEDLWSQKFNDEITPSLYSSWNNPVVFRKTDGDQKVVCYFQSWAVYRPKPLDFDIKDIDPFACTHIIYAFAGIHKENFTIMSLDEDRDVLQGAYKALVALKARNHDLKILIAVGGYEEGGRKYSEMVSTKETRKRFIESVVTFIEEHAFDGLDLNWEYPGAADRGGKQSDRENLALLLEELYPIFKGKSLTLTLAAPIDKVADHHAPLEKRKTDIYIHKGLNLKEGVQLFLDQGAPTYKLVVGVPFYGRTFTLENPKENTPGSKIVNVGKEGRFTRQKGYLAYYEICMEQRNGGWDISRDEAGGTYMVKGDQWVGYDDEDYIEKKVDYIKYENLGGVMLWSMDLDDYLGLCGTRWPLLSALRASLHIPKTTTTSEAISAAASSLDEGEESFSSRLINILVSLKSFLILFLSSVNVYSERSTPDLNDKKSSNSTHGKESSNSDIVGSNIDSPKGFQCQGPGYYRNDNFCGVYYVCNEKKKAFRFECPSGMGFDLQTKICNWKEKISCGKGFAPLVFTNEISCQEDGLYSDPTNCRNYVWCKEKNAIILSCPQNLYFNSRTGSCGTKNNTFCLLGQMAKAPGGNHSRYYSATERTSLRATSEDFKIVCYFTNWAWLRVQEGAFYPEHIDPNLCTHVIYSFAILDSSTFEILSPDTYTDIEYRFYQRVLALRQKNPNLKVLLGLGGWTDSSGDKYSRLVNNPEARTVFVHYAVNILNSYEFDGLDLHWEYPVCWQIDCRKGPSTDKQGFAALVRELHQMFIQQPKRLILSAAVSPARAIIARAYDIRTLSANLDFINVMTYDYHGFWEKKTGHVSPLLYREGDQFDSQNTDFSINYWIQYGADPKKLIMGIPFYGQTFQLANPGQNSLNNPVIGPGNAGPVTQQRGMLSYAEICQRIRTPGWRKATDNTGAIGPFATKGDQWISFDDPNMIMTKGKYIRNTGLGGAMVWSIGFDDFQNFCCREPMPLLRALNRELRSIPYPPPRPGGDCTKPAVPVTPPPPIRTTTFSGDRPKKPTTQGGNLDIPTSSKRTTFWSESTTTRRTTVWSQPTTTKRSTFWSRPTAATTPRTTKPTTTTITTSTTTTFRTPTSSTTRKSTVFPVASTPRPEDHIKPGSPCSSNIPTPHPTDCSKFYRCVQGQIKETTCAPGLNWNNKAQYCDWPNNAQCDITGGFPTTFSPLTTLSSRTTPRVFTTTTTTPRTTKQTTWWKPQTSSRRTTWRIPITTPTTTTRRTTKRTTWWKPQISTTTRIPALQTFTQRSTTRVPQSEIDFHQPGGPCGSQDNLPHPFDCTKFLRCVKHQLTEASCAPGLHWNPHKKTCDWPNNAQCQPTERPSHTNRGSTSFLRRTTPVRIPPRRTTRIQTQFPIRTTTTTTARTTERTTRTPASSHSSKCSGRETKAALGVCSKYFECVNGQFLLRDCPPGLEWNERRSTCDWPLSANCLVSVRATSPSVPFQEITPAEKVHSLSGPSEGDSCSGSETIRSSNCQKFLICNQGAYTAKRCGDGLHWNDREKICDWPHNAKCKGIKRPPKVPVKPPTGESFPEEVSTPQTQTHPSVSLEPAPSAGPLSGDFMVVCYFTNWAWYRSGSGKFLPDDIDEGICTHIVYGFAVLDYSNLIIKPHDSWADIDNRFYERVTALRAKGIKVTIAIGGWNDSEGDKYSRLVHSPSSRARFIEHVVGFIKKHNFDGLDLDWEYPVCWQVNCKKGPASDKEEFSNFVRELSAAFKPHGLLLSAAVSPNKVVIDKVVVVIVVDYAIRYWIEKGGDKKKIVLGMPLYGQAFTLNDASVNGLNAPANQKGHAGTYTKAPGFLAYYEICKSVTRDGWNVVKDPEGRMGPYAYKGNQWVSYDDVATIRKKSQYIRDNGLGGGMVWALDLDDFNNVCGQGKYPLMKTIQSVLGPADTGSPGMMVVQTQRPSHSVPHHPNRQPVPSHHVPPQPQLPPVIDFPVHVSPIGADDNIVVCYFTNWAWYREGEGMFLPENIDSQLCTHIIYGFATLDETELIMRPSDIETDINNNFYSRILEFKKAGIKVLISLGGWNDSGGDKFSRLVNNPAARKKFNEHALSFVQQYGFDGLDLDWEFPKCWQTDCTRGPMSDKEGFTSWIRELSDLFKPYRYLLSAVVSPSREIVPLWSSFNNFTISYWIKLGADPKKLVLGMPLYGQSFTLENSNNNGLNAPTVGGGKAGPYTRAMGFLAYYEICHSIKYRSWNIVRDSFGTMGPYAYLGNQWVGFDDVKSIQMKAEYVKQMGLRGAMIWALDFDDFVNRCLCDSYPLLKTINRVLRNYPSPKDECPMLGETSQGQPQTTPTPTSTTTHSSTRPHFIVASTLRQKLTQTPHPSSPPPLPVQEAPQGQFVAMAGKPCNAGEFRPHHDCSKFYECYQGKLREVSCYRGLHHKGAGKCDRPEVANCKGIRIRPESSPSVVTPSMSAPDFVIETRPEHQVAVKQGSDFGTEGEPCSDGTFKRHVQCNKFYQCLHGKLTERRCLPGLNWDGQVQFYQKVTGLKAKGIRVLLAIGGWNDSKGSKYSRLVNDPSARAKFIQHVVQFIEKHNFDGLDLDWEYPKCWQVDCDAGPASDKDAFSAWIRELRAAFTPRNWLLTAAVSPSYKVIEAGYNVKDLTDYLDFVNVMTYDYHGHWDKKTGHVAPMLHHPESPAPEFNANYTINYFIEKGANPKKLIMGMPMYGQSFSLTKMDNTGLNSPARKGQAGEYTRAAGFLAYYEICHKVLSQGYKVMKDPSGSIGPYAYKGNQWVGFDDVNMIRFKSEYIKNMGLGGGMIWALDLDDFRNRCNCESHPLLKTINRVLRNYPEATVDCTLG
ncbi:putative chitinase 3 [Armadillidium nasatum]|uniref:chitinase n=1 Tax=Armadillidium nasatum TaxID=96803 RepID=A0A5N5TE34_9CRUS|nr:putative chitinase 3 [Armadillidium nasatum]